MPGASPRSVEDRDRMSPSGCALDDLESAGLRLGCFGGSAGCAQAASARSVAPNGLVVSIPAGITLIALVRNAVDRVGAAIFAVSLTGLYGVSAAYHRGHWSPRGERLMKHLDHSMINDQ